MQNLKQKIRPQLSIIKSDFHFILITVCVCVCVCGVCVGGGGWSFPFSQNLLEGWAGAYKMFAFLGGWGGGGCCWRGRLKEGGRLLERRSLEDERRVNRRQKRALNALP